MLDHEQNNISTRATKDAIVLMAIVPPCVMCFSTYFKIWGGACHTEALSRGFTMTQRVVICDRSTISPQDYVSSLVCLWFDVSVFCFYQCVCAGGLSVPFNQPFFIKPFYICEDGEVYYGSIQKTVLTVHDLQAFRQHCIRTHHSTVINWATRVQEHFSKPLLLNTVLGQCLEPESLTQRESCKSILLRIRVLSTNLLCGQMSP